MEGIKFDQEKLQWDLVPWKQMEEVVEVLMDGAKKYAPNNWQKVMPKRRYRNAMIRHVIEYLFKRRFDKDGGREILAHVICNTLFLMWVDQTPKCYIAGPMRGYDNFNYEEFFKAEEKVRELGYEPINPARISQEVESVYEKPGYTEYLKEDIRYLVDCSAIYMLVGWDHSQGASLEHHIANNLGMKIHYQ